MFILLVQIYSYVVYIISLTMSLIVNLSFTFFSKYGTTVECITFLYM